MRTTCATPYASTFIGSPDTGVEFSHDDDHLHSQDHAILAKAIAFFLELLRLGVDPRAYYPSCWSPRPPRFDRAILPGLHLDALRLLDGRNGLRIQRRRDHMVADESDCVLAHHGSVFLGVARSSKFKRLQHQTKDVSYLR